MAKKSLGQHWLRDPASLQKIIDTAQLESHDTVLEIGPGQGDLTRLLLDSSKTVVAVEVDEELIDQLVATMPHGSFFLVHEDIRTFDFSRLPAGYKIVANIPYYITSSIIRMLLELEHKPVSITLLIQKEVAERILASPGEMSVLSVSVQLFADVVAGPVIAAEHFEPAPKVDSQVIYLKLLESPRLDVDEKQFFRMVKAGFSARRKKLKSSLAGGLRKSKDDVSSLLKGAGISTDARAQELSLDQWGKLYNKLYNSDNE